MEGDLRLGGEFRTYFFASGSKGTGRVEACEPPQRLLLLTKHVDESYELVIEATLTADGDQTILVVEERGSTSRGGGNSSFPPTKRWRPTSASYYDAVRSMSRTGLRRLPVGVCTPR